MNRNRRGVRWVGAGLVSAAALSLGSCGGGGGGGDLPGSPGGDAQFAVTGFNFDGLGGAAINEVLEFAFNADLDFSTVDLTTVQFLDLTGGLPVTGTFEPTPGNPRAWARRSPSPEGRPSGRGTGPS